MDGGGKIEAGGRVWLTIEGEPASLKNSRRAAPGVSKAGKVFTRFITSQKAEQWRLAAARQVPARLPLLEGPLVAYIRIYYATQRPDLDEAIILDFLQGRIFLNDRQVREKHVYHEIDRANPRAEIVIEPRR